MQVTMSGSGVCSHPQHLQHSHRTCSRPIVSLSSAFRRGCSLQTRQQAARPQRMCRLAAQAAFGEGDEEEDSNRRRGRRRRDDDEDSGPRKEAEEKDNFEERLVQVRRVTKVVKGGKQLSFRAVVVVGDKAGTVGVGCGSAKEMVEQEDAAYQTLKRGTFSLNKIAQAVERAVLLAKRESVTFPLNKAYSLPHRIDGFWGAAKVMLRPAADGAGVIAGGAVRVVLELAGVRNCFGKQLGSANPLNNARATIEGMRNLRTFKMVSQQRGISVQELMGLDAEPKVEASPAIADAMAGQV